MARSGGRPLRSSAARRPCAATPGRTEMLTKTTATALALAIALTGTTAEARKAKGSGTSAP